MKVTARSVDWAACPQNIRPYTVKSQTFLTVGQEYDVHALAIFKGHPMLQIVNDIGWPSWCAGWLFDTTDEAVPSDRICTLLHEEPSLLLGPEFVARDEDAYGFMVELEADQVDRFWKRVEALKASHDEEQ